MSSLVIKIEGVKELEKKLSHLRQPKLDRTLGYAVLEGARSLRTPLRRAAPKGPTGNLRRSISARKGRGVSATVGPRAPHAHLVIGGTQPHLIRPRRRALRFGTIFAARVSHPGSRPNPFVERVAQAESHRVRDAIAKRLMRAFHR